MKFYLINGKDNCWRLVNLQLVIFVDFDEAAYEIIFDNILHVKVDKQDYAAIRNDILRKMIIIP